MGSKSIQDLLNELNEVVDNHTMTKQAGISNGSNSQVTTNLADEILNEIKQDISGGEENMYLNKQANLMKQAQEYQQAYQLGQQYGEQLLKQAAYNQQVNNQGIDNNYIQKLASIAKIATDIAPYEPAIQELIAQQLLQQEEADALTQAILNSETVNPELIQGLGLSNQDAVLAALLGEQGGVDPAMLEAAMAEQGAAPSPEDEIVVEAARRLINRQRYY
jgi:hypothetical protein